MKVFILGLGKSGTSILAYRILHGLPEPRELFSEHSRFGLGVGENPELHEGFCRAAPSVVSKNIIYPELFQDCSLLERCAAPYDRKVFILRDPRDYLISEFFYRHYWRHHPERQPLKALYRLAYEYTLHSVRQLERYPRSRPFHRLSPLGRPHRGFWQKRFSGLTRLLQNLDSNWHLIRYEDLVDNCLVPLESYLGFQLDRQAELGDDLRRIARSKSYGNWRRWFSEEDVRYYQPVLNDFLEIAGYNKDDWRLEENPVLSAEEGSNYMRKLFLDRTL